MAGLSRLYDDKNSLVAVLCPICFDYNEPVSAREGGRLSTENGDTYDVCVDCAAKEYLIAAFVMGA